jgi:catechol 2,3-dioxygenase-like lactoylglutathione lyase family enzyme
MDSPIEKLTVVTVVVKDQDAALAFYTNALGLEKKTDVSSPDGFRWLTVAPKGQDIEMMLWKAGSGGEGFPQSHSRAGNGTSWNFQVKDCQKAYTELKARGVNFKSEPADNPWSVVAAFTDPDGNPFSIVQLKAMSSAEWNK